MKIFVKTNMASLIASLCDYMVTIFLRQFFYVDAVIAGITGTIVGGMVNFYVCRLWVFKVNKTSVSLQGKRYLIIWTGNLLMNAGGLYVLINIAGVHYIIAKLITSLTVAFGYNYPLQKLYVFKNNLVQSENRSGIN